MHPILIKEWIPPQVAEGEDPQYNDYGNLYNKAEGTGQWATDFTKEALFHSWITEYTRDEDSTGSTRVYAMAILPDGTVRQMHPDNIKFIFNSTKTT